MALGMLVACVASFVLPLLKNFGVLPPITIGPGWWKATAPGLVTFEFKVNGDQSAITEFVFHIPKITCPDIIYSASSVDVHYNSWTGAAWAL